jgi:opacity protein-like surface antigen
MKKITGLVPLAFSLLLSTGTAGAADYTASVDPIASWTGFYGAIGGGVRWGDFDIKTNKIRHCDYDPKSIHGCENPCDYASKSEGDGCENPCEPVAYTSEGGGCENPCEYATRSSSECDYKLGALEVYENPYTIPGYSGDDRGFFGTVQIGYNHQFDSSPIVVGAFASADFGNKLEVHVEEAILGPAPTVALDIYDPYREWTASVGNIFTVGGRLGIATSERVLLYALIGWSWTKGKASFEEDCGLYVGLICTNLQGSNSETLDGLTVGAGGEIKITDTIGLGVEFRHTDFGSINVTADGGPLTLTQIGGTTVETKTDVTVQSLRGLLVFHF